MSAVLLQYASEISWARDAMRAGNSISSERALLALDAEVERLEADSDALRVECDNTRRLYLAECAENAKLRAEVKLGYQALTPEHHVDDLYLDEKPDEPEGPAPETKPPSTVLTLYKDLYKRVEALERILAKR